MRLRLDENYRFVLYAPFYAAHAIGAYAAEGLEVEMSPSPGMGRAEQALLDDAVDVIWAGPIARDEAHDDNPGSPLCALPRSSAAIRSPIVGRRPNPDFGLADLTSLAVCDSQRSADAMALPPGGSPAGGGRPGAARSCCRWRHGGQPRGFARRPARSRAALRTCLSKRRLARKLVTSRQLRARAAARPTRPLSRHEIG